MKNSKSRTRTFVVCALSFVLAVVLFIGVMTSALRPRRLSHGAMWESYRAEEKDSLGAIVLGSSYAYCDVIPALIYEKTGITSFVLASPVQPMSLSYFYLREALKTQSPRIVALEVSALYLDSIDTYTQVGIDYMPIGANKLRAVFSEEAKSIRGELLFPMGVYHSRWDELSIEDFRRAGVDMLAGYTYLSAVTGESDSMRRMLRCDNENDEDDEGEEEKAEKEKIERNFRYLDRIASLCSERGIKLICFLSPSGDALGEDEAEKIALHLDAQGVTFVDYSHGDAFSSLGLSDLDWFNSSHLNVSGAKKFTPAIADELSALGADTAQGKCDDKLWEERIEYFYSYSE